MAAFSRFAMIFRDATTGVHDELRWCNAGRKLCMQAEYTSGISSKSHSWGDDPMTANRTNRIQEVLTKFEKDIVEDWLKEQMTALTLRKDLLSEADLRRESVEFMSLLSPAVLGGNMTDITTPEWASIRDFLVGLSHSRTAKNFTPTETATFVLSLKQPLFARLREAVGEDADALAHEVWTATVLLDKLGLFTCEAFVQSREKIIRRQQEEMLELSTPVVKLWDGILALPLIGTLDSVRTQIVMESLLQSIVETGSEIAIIDITGVPAVDTLVAQHLLKTVAAAQLMGAQCIISGIRPQIAQTMVHLGVAFGGVITKASLADALAYAFKQIGIAAIRKET
jgi:rsbT co-antagonist protein RsbR